MGRLKQENDSFAIYMGWYGKCGSTDELNSSYEIKQHSEIKAVYQTSNSGLKSFVSSAPDFLQSLSHFKPGNSYWVVLGPGNSEFEIPNLTLSSSHLSQDGVIPTQLISDCELRLEEGDVFLDASKNNKISYVENENPVMSTNWPGKAIDIKTNNQTRLQISDKRIEIKYGNNLSSADTQHGIAWPWPFGANGTRAGFIFQHHDDQDIGDNRMEAGAMFDFEQTRESYGT